VAPFAGTVKDGFIWGRGTTDDKINLISICESVEKLLAEGFHPKRTLYIIFGHDEEIGGKGAKAVAARMEAMGIKADLLMDEGGIITKEKLPGITKPVALLGTAEKGYLSLELTAQALGGHSSMPEKETSVDLLSKALVKLRQNPFPAKFTEPMEGLMEAVGPEMPFLQRMAFANPWLFKGMIASTYEKTGAGNAMLHTTLVPTIIEGGIKDNVMPSQVKATINLRLLPGDSVETVIKQVEEIIGDPRVTVAKHKGAISEASAVTSVKSFGYQKMEKIMKQSYPEVITSPFLMIGATDSRHFGKVSSNIIKFSPMIDPIGFHGIDERVSLESFQTALWFYEQLLRDGE
jgi:carboxypeptidase PM20D1